MIKNGFFYKLKFLFKSRENVRNSLWSIAGNFIPLLIGLWFIPLIIQEMGIVLFGILTIVWMLVGYFTLFDLGISRALTFILSKNIGNKEYYKNNQIYSTAIPIVLVLGFFSGLIFWFISPYLVDDVFKIDAVIRDDVLYSFRITAVMIPLSIFSVVAKGCLESFNEFKQVNIIKVPVGVWYFLGPYLFYLWGGSFSWAVGSIFIARVALVIFYFNRVRYHLKFSFFLINQKSAKSILTFGGWMTVSNIISPIMVYFDRFFIGAFVAIGVVGYYSAPYEVVTKVLIFPASLATVMLPLFTNLLASGNIQLFQKKLTVFIFVVMGVVGLSSLLLIAFGRVGLALWLGEDFAKNGYWVVFWLSLGVFFNSIGQMYFTVLQAAGKSKTTALIHLYETPFYLVFLWLGEVLFGGVSVVAFVWFIRVFFDMLLMMIFSKKLVLS